MWEVYHHSVNLLFFNSLCEKGLGEITLHMIRGNSFIITSVLLLILCNHVELLALPQYHTAEKLYQFIYLLSIPPSPQAHGGSHH